VRKGPSPTATVEPCTVTLCGIDESSAVSSTTGALGTVKSIADRVPSAVIAKTKVPVAATSSTT
jgi:hypothetical protein